MVPDIGQVRGECREILPISVAYNHLFLGIRTRRVPHTLPEACPFFPYFICRVPGASRVQSSNQRARPQACPANAKGTHVVLFSLNKTFFTDFNSKTRRCLLNPEFFYLITATFINHFCLCERNYFK